MPWARGGFVGVDLFFVLSGFLITTLLCQELEAAGRIDLRNFYVRRGLRLFPALATLLLAYAAWLVLRYGPGALGNHARDFAAVIFYVANWVFAFTPPGGESLGPLAHTWSLSLEEQFYLAWPLLLAGLATSRRSPWTRLVVVTAAVVASLAWRVVLVHQRTLSVRMYAGTDTRIGTLLVGCVLALALRPGGPLAGQGRRRSADLAGLVAAVVFAAFVARANIDARALYLGGLEAIAVTSAVMIHAAVCGQGLFVRLMSLAPLRWLGRISYGVYVWHLPIVAFCERTHLVFARTPLPPVWIVRIGLATLLVAVVSYRVIETPFLRRRDRFGPRGLAGRGRFPEVPGRPGDLARRASSDAAG